MTADLRDRLQAALGSSYTLERELGGGGMSRVFLATEAALDRSVVIKVLPPELAQAVSTERFRQEVRVAARLQHPHIVPLLSAGQADDLLYYTMPYVAGESLRARLGREGELPIADGVRLLRDLAAALAHAHEHGLVHRDIKPDNLLLSDGEGLVTDFGVAKAISASAAADSSGLTSLGVALGTPAYMAPEQAAADPQTDHRADIYAFGCVAYEILTGQPPFAGRAAAALLAAHAADAPEPVSRRRSAVPPPLAALVMRCLEKRPADRPRNAAEVLHLLDGITTPLEGSAPTTRMVAGAPARRRVMLMALGAAAVLMLVALPQLWRRTHPAAARTGAVRLVVLPFENLGAPADDYFADGIADEVRGKLAALPGLEVMARASSNQYRRSTQSPAEIGRELGVQYLLSGTVRWAQAGSGRRVRVSPELIRAGAGATAWQESFDAPLTDVFTMQADIAGRVAEALGVALAGGEQQKLRQRPTHNLAAYDAFLRGERILITEGANDLGSAQQAIAAYEEAVRQDSNFVLGWARLSRAYSLAFTQGTVQAEYADAARHAAERAMALAPNQAESRYALAYYESYVTEDEHRALKLYEAVRHLTPNDPDLLSGMAHAELRVGRPDSALAHLRAARTLDPRSGLVLRRSAEILTALGKYDEALETSDELLSLTSSSLTAWKTRLLERLARGDLDGARSRLHEVPDTIRPQVFGALGFPPDVVWMLDRASQDEMLALSAETAFGGDRVLWALALAGIEHQRGNRVRQRVYADSAASMLRSWIAVRANYVYAHSYLGLALAYQGKAAEARRAGQRSLELTSRDNMFDRPYFEVQHARTLMIDGDREGALDQLEAALSRPSYVTRGMVRIDPMWAPMRGHPRFEGLVREGK